MYLYYYLKIKHLKKELMESHIKLNRKYFGCIIITLSWIKSNEILDITNIKNDHLKFIISNNGD